MKRVPATKQYPLDRFRVFHVRTRKQLRRLVAGTSQERSIDPGHDNDEIDVIYNNCVLAGIELSFARYGGALRMNIPEARSYLQIFPVRGAMEVSTSHSEFLLQQQGTFIVSPNEARRIHIQPGFERLTLKVHVQSLVKKLAAMTGAPVARPLKFDAAQDASEPEAQFLRQMVLHLVDQMSGAGAPIPALALSEFEHAVMVAYLCCNRHSYSHVLGERPHEVAPAQVRSAEEYIRANFDRPIRIEDIAAAANASARSVFRTFKKIRGVTPMEFLKQVRLQHARRMLGNPEAPITVGDAAFACGFSELGHFSRDYRRSFGELPSATLRRAR
jgi:AraC-like DNA-binding protein